MHRAYVSLGANLGDPEMTLKRAFEALRELGTLVKRSGLYRTQPWGNADQPEFVNAVALLETTRTARELLHALQSVETALGRRPRERWGPRELDLDILTFDDAAIDEPGLHVPHPHMRERAFVLVPLAEIDPAYEPLRDALPPSERAGVVPIGGTAS
jgi:2-amino-4-hydroxy-6-hydroxymethyldihydropteridine diphosphokinase